MRMVHDEHAMETGGDWVETAGSSDGDQLAVQAPGSRCSTSAAPAVPVQSAAPVPTNDVGSLPECRGSVSHFPNAFR